MKQKIICAFPCCGKTWTYLHQDYLPFGRIADSDSSLYSWTDVEEPDGGYSMVRNPSFPWNYINNAQELLADGWNIIFLSTHREVLEELERRGLDYVVVYPCRELRKVWLKRALECKYNGFDPEMVFSEDIFDKFINDIEEVTAEHPEKRYKICSTGELMVQILRNLGLERGGDDDASRDSG